MKGLAFALDPDGYWVEIVRRRVPDSVPNYFDLSQTMIRIKDPAESIPFYEAMGMRVLSEAHLDGFSLYFLKSSSDRGGTGGAEGEEEEEEETFGPVLELTHNHGTEHDAEFKHCDGNEEGRQGFGHVGFLVDDVYEACDAIRKMGFGFKKVSDICMCIYIYLCSSFILWIWMSTWRVIHRVTFLCVCLQSYRVCVCTGAGWGFDEGVGVCV